MDENQDVRSLFANYVISSGKLNDLKKLSSELDLQIRDSYMFTKDIRTKWNSLNASNKTADREPDRDDVARHEDIAKFLDAGPPKLLLPDMEELFQFSLNKPETIVRLLKALEHLNIKIQQQSLPEHYIEKDFKPSELESFSSILQQFCDRISKLKNIEYNGEKKKDTVLEEKLLSFCNNVTLLTKMIESSVSISKCNEEWGRNHPESKELTYTEVFKNLLDSINELTFMFLEVRKS